MQPRFHIARNASYEFGAEDAGATSTAVVQPLTFWQSLAKDTFVAVIQGVATAIAIHYAMKWAGK